MFYKKLLGLILIFSLGLWGCVPPPQQATVATSSNDTSVVIDNFPTGFEQTKPYWAKFTQVELKIAQKINPETKAFTVLCAYTMIQLYKTHSIKLSDKVYKIVAANNIAKLYILLSIVRGQQKGILTDIMTSGLWWKVQTKDPYVGSLLGWTMAELSMIRCLCHGQIPMQAYIATLLTLDVVSQYPLIQHTGPEGYSTQIWSGLGTIDKIYTLLTGHSLFPKDSQATPNGISL